MINQVELMMFDVSGRIKHTIPLYDQSSFVYLVMEFYQCEKRNMPKTTSYLWNAWLYLVAQ